MKTASALYLLPQYGAPFDSSPTLVENTLPAVCPALPKSSATPRSNTCVILPVKLPIQAEPIAAVARMKKRAKTKTEMPSTFRGFRTGSLAKM